jgi:hypothetical protein
MRLRRSMEIVSDTSAAISAADGWVIREASANMCDLACIAGACCGISGSYVRLCQQVRRVFLIVLALTVFLPSMAFARFLCRTDGQVRDHCCCAHKKHEQPLTPGARAASCCDVTPAKLTTAAPAERTTRDQIDASPVAVAAPIAAPSMPTTTRMWIAARSTAPPEPSGPSLFARHCALLL